MTSLLHFDLKRHQHQVDKFIRRFLRSTPITVGDIFKDMDKDLYSVIIGDGPESLEVRKDAYHALLETGELDHEAITGFKVLRRDFLEQYYDLLLVVQEAHSLPRVVVVGQNKCLFYNNDDLLVIATEPCPDLIRAFTVINAFGHPEEDVLQAYLYVMDRDGGTHLLEVYWNDPAWVPLWANTEPSEALVDGLYILMSNRNAPPYYALELYETYWNYKVTVTSSPQQGSDEAWALLAENGDEIVIRTLYLPNDLRGTGVWINGKPIVIHDWTKESVEDYLGQLTRELPVATQNRL